MTCVLYSGSPILVCFCKLIVSAVLAYIVVYRYCDSVNAAAKFDVLNCTECSNRAPMGRQAAYANPSGSSGIASVDRPLLDYYQSQ